MTATIEAKVAWETGLPETMRGSSGCGAAAAEVLVAPSSRQDLRHHRKACLTASAVADAPPRDLREDRRHFR